MSKFKIGDRVRAMAGHYQDMQPGSPYNLPRTHGVVLYSGDGFLKVGYGDFVSPPVNPSFFELATSGPIRTVTRREIVPCDARLPSGREIIVAPQGRYANIAIPALALDATDLRAAAKLFNELADVLEEQQQKEAA